MSSPNRLRVATDSHSIIPGLLVVIIEQQSKIQGSCDPYLPQMRSIKC